jgi:tetratricopeptide (TPR) repeat protein
MLLSRVLPSVDHEHVPIYEAGLHYVLGELCLRNQSSMAAAGDYESAHTAFTITEQRFGPMGSAGMARGMCHLGMGKAKMMEAREHESVEAVNEALTDFRRAVAVLPVRNYPFQWAVVMSEMGRALVKQGELDGVEGPFEQALLAFQGAQRVMPRNEKIADWALNTYSLGSTLLVLGKLKRSPDMVRQALVAFNQAAEAYEEAEAHGSARSAYGNVYRCEQLLEDLAPTTTEAEE